MPKKSLLSLLSMFVLTSAVLPCLAWTEEVRFPVSAYTPQELSRVRRWEKNWDGRTITKEKVVGVSAFLPECLVQVYLKPEKCGGPPEGFYFHIAPYEQIMPTTGVVEATMRYAPTVRITGNGSIETYAHIAGVPFPNPKTGLEIAWNFDFNTRGDSSRFRRYTPNIDLANKAERPQEAECWELYFAHRVDREPRPMLHNNKKKIHWAGFYHMYKPNEYANTRRYTLRYLDFDRDDDQYMYNSLTRRLMRLSTAHRTDAVEGSSIIYDDEYCWNGQIPRNSYTYLGRKEYLAVRHLDADVLERQSGQIIFNNIKRERISTLAVEVVSKDPSYIYSKRIWYVDPETYNILCSQVYDRNGRFWKFMEQLCENVSNENGEHKSFVAACHVIDYRRKFAAVSTQAVKAVGRKMNPFMFTMANLQRTY